MTSSPGPTPSTLSEALRAVVPPLDRTQRGTPIASANIFWKS
jgi:hypothetical protein